MSGIYLLTNSINISRSNDDNLGACTRAGIGMSISASCEHYVAPDCIFIRRVEIGKG